MNTLFLFEPNIYSDRRRQLKQHLGPDGLILLFGNEESSRNYKDNCYPFRQDSTFLYYFGLNVAGLAGIIDLESGEEFLIGADQSMDDIIWMGRLPKLAEMAQRVDITKVLSVQNGMEFINRAIAAGRIVHNLPPYRPENQIKLAIWLGVNQKKVSERTSGKLVKAVILQRAIKSSIEIEELEKAVSISVDMQMVVMSNAKPGVKGFELVAKAQQVAIASNACLAYPAIITAEGQTLHTHDYNYTLEEGRMLLCDIGAENQMHYGGDLTRTIPIGRKFSSRQREIYEVVLQAQILAEQMLGPGVRYKDIHLAACEKLAEGLVELGLMRGSPNEIVSAGAHTMFFQCGLGHMLGMDTHDMEDLGEELVGYGGEVIRDPSFGMKSLRLARTLEQGYVLTVEPGVYIIPELIDLWQAEKKHVDFINYSVLNTYRDFGGIRIEDNYLITANGSKTLGKYLPKSLQEIEALKG